MHEWGPWGCEVVRSCMCGCEGSCCIQCEGTPEQKPSAVVGRGEVRFERMQVP